MELQQPDLTTIGASVLAKRYLVRNKEGEVVETAQERFVAVAKHVAQAEQNYGVDPETIWPSFYRLMACRDFLPNTPCIVNAGRPAALLSACIVLPIEDSMPSIFGTLRDMALCHKGGAGCIGGESTVLTDQGPITMKALVEGKLRRRVLSHYADGGAQFTPIDNYHRTKLPPGRVYEVELDGASVRASDWHPFFVWRGDTIEEVRADALVPGDAVIGSTRWNGTVGALSERAWLAGFIVSDGGFDDTVNGLRLRICKGYEEPIARAAHILNINYGPSKDPRYQSPVWDLCTVGPKAEHVRAQFGEDLFSVYTKRLPAWIWGADVQEQLSMLVGLLDGDGWFGNDHNAFFYGSVSKRLIEEIEALAGMVGLRTQRRTQEAKPEKNEAPFYSVSFARSPWLVDLMRTHSARHNPSWSYTQGVIPLSKAYLGRLSELNYPTNTREAMRKGLEIGSHRIAIQRYFYEGIATREVAALILTACGNQTAAAAVHSARIVQNVQVAEEGDILYDLTVPGPQNYIAGCKGFVVAHNTGFSFSRIRPAKDFVQSTTGLASGPISFMRAYNNVTECVKQSGVRRGANMSVLRCDHPDILEFIDCKQNLDELNNFNISVGITNAFMEALTADESYPLINPRTDKVTGTLRARSVFDRIVRNAHASGEPGLFFLDRVNELDPVASSEDPIEAPNPCQPGWAPILTPKGIRTFDDLIVGSTIWSGRQWTTVTQKVCTGIKPTYRYHTRAGTFVGTTDHRILENSNKVKVSAAESIDLAFGQLGDPDVKLHPQDVMDGLIIGDGMTHKASGGLPFLLIGRDDECYHQSEIASLIIEHRPGVKETAHRVGTTIEEVPLTYERSVPSRFLYGPAVTVQGFLRGLYSANGSVCGNRVTLKASSFNIIHDVQMMLSTLGIPSYYTTNKEHDVEFENGIYCCRESYDLNIGAGWARRRFRDLIGFIHPDRNRRLDATCDTQDAPWKQTYDIVDIEPLGNEVVYDITVEDETHTYWTGGLYASNCGEQPLHPYDACDLGSLNLVNFYDEEKREMNFDRLAATIQLAVRFLDDVHDVNQYPIPQLAERIHNNRRIGLGVMAWADLLIIMGIPYASQQALDLAETLAQFINTKAIEASEGLAVLRGPFPIFEKSKHFTNKQKPRRNATVTTIAPTGSISIIAGCSGGIEPLFAIVQTRRQAEMKMVDVNPMFVEAAKREGFYSEALMERVKDTGTVKDDPDVPIQWQRVFAVANEISLDYHIKMQAAFQRHTECAVSKTANLPHNATVKDVERAYQLAWDEGCKGITVYRDKSRENQTLTRGTSSTRPELHPIPTVPYDAKVWPIKTPTGKLSVKLCLDAGRPFETWFDTSRPGTAIHALSEALGRLGSLVLRMDSPIDPMHRVELIADQLAGLGGGDSVGFGSDRVLSMPDGASKALRVLLRALTAQQVPEEPETPKALEGQKSPPPIVVAPSNGQNVRGSLQAPVKSSSNGNGNGHKHARSFGDICPDCHQATLYHTEGCTLCPCGFSRC